MAKYKVGLLDKNDTEACVKYEDFVSNHINGNFLQSLSWPKIKDSWGYEVIIVKEKDVIVASSLVLIRTVPITKKTFLYSPRGPVYDYDNKEIFKYILDGINMLASKYKSYLFRMDPCVEESNEEFVKLIRDSGFDIDKSLDDYGMTQMKHHYVLEFKGRTEDEVFANFQTTWRYNTRLAKKKGVECIIGTKDNIDDFYELMKVTGKRDNFNIRSKEYFIKLLDVFGDKARLYMCYVGDIPISGALITNYAGKASYVYGASANTYREYKPNYLMQWEIIKWAIETNCEMYDFMGVPFYYDEKHPNYGVYSFKKGFNGRVATYVGEYDLIFKPVMGRLFRWYLKRKK